MLKNVFYMTNIHLENISSSFFKNLSVKRKEGDPKASFSIATTPRCMRRRYSFSELLNFTLDTYLIIPSVKQGGIKYHFLSL